MNILFSLFLSAVGEQWAQTGTQAKEESSESQSYPGSAPGSLLQCLASLFYHQHGTGQSTKQLRNINSLVYTYVDLNKHVKKGDGWQTNCSLTNWQRERFLFNWAIIPYPTLEVSTILSPICVPHFAQISSFWASLSLALLHTQYGVWIALHLCLLLSPSSSVASQHPLPTD